MQCPTIKGDMNGDGVQTISDVWLMLSAAYHWPGRWSVEAMSQNPQTALFLELNAASCGGWLSFALSTAAWVLVLLALASIQVAIDEWGRR